MKKVFGGLLVSLLLAGTAAAQSFEEGQDYRELASETRTATGDRIEVREFFAYACPGCNAFYPMVGQWSETLDDDVELVHSPVVFHPSWENLARAYHVADALDVTDVMHGAIFNAYHNDNQRLETEDSLVALFEEQGVDPDDVRAQWNGFSVDGAMRSAERSASRHGVQRTPSMGVNGRYYIDTELAGDFDRMLRVVDYLVEKERQAGR
ncbi:thiol:disulfide interchange protein DsbA/DsbL [Methylonatrum kenyense]|uniref:thiol:disulfide interchange protein DsbA/DsbL n=1 Tax=Methylonatrum kenyense TaxID=455253 RepID=UPI0020C07A01|nr:thiol:disulfide interchange protein DsbA/DsbL [Methylonatrum kenyense]MCK8515223.1 thiol:disulfide interchange protein DsbA/DsbL [Methylonatrum kenyense]